MNLLADEGVERQIVEGLRRGGHAVQYIAEMAPGISDDVILAHANSQQALLVTLDKDFGEMVYRQGLVHAGVILLLYPENPCPTLSLRQAASATALIVRHLCCAGTGS